QLYYALTSRRCLTATFIQRDRDNRDLHSFPTRRSSDLSLQRLNTTNKDYKDLKFKPNSVIYCDPPYKNTEDYGVKFNHDEFYEWALNQNNPVYISEYSAPKDFKLVKQISHRSTLSASNNDKQVIENLYWNRKGNPKKTTLF